MNDEKTSQPTRPQGTQAPQITMTAEVSVTSRKAEEISYFQFSDSDMIVLFEASSNMNLAAQVGTKIEEAYPVL